MSCFGESFFILITNSSLTCCLLGEKYKKKKHHWYQVFKEESVLVVNAWMLRRKMGQFVASKINNKFI